MTEVGMVLEELRYQIRHVRAFRGRGACARP